MDQETTIHRVIRKKFPRNRQRYSSRSPIVDGGVAYEPKPAFFSQSVCNITPYGPLTPSSSTPSCSSPSSGSGTPSCSPPICSGDSLRPRKMLSIPCMPRKSNYTRTCIPLSSVPPNSNAKESETSYSLERLRSLSPGKSRQASQLSAAFNPERTFSPSGPGLNETVSFPKLEQSLSAKSHLASSQWKVAAPNGTSSSADLKQVGFPILTLQSDLFNNMNLGNYIEALMPGAKNYQQQASSAFSFYRNSTWNKKRRTPDFDNEGQVEESKQDTVPCPSFTKLSTYPPASKAYIDNCYYNRLSGSVEVDPRSAQEENELPKMASQHSTLEPSSALYRNVSKKVVLERNDKNVHASASAYTDSQLYNRVPYNITGNRQQKDCRAFMLRYQDSQGCEPVCSSDVNGPPFPLSKYGDDYGQLTYSESSKTLSETSSCPTSPENSSFSDDREVNLTKTEDIRCRNAFQSAHNELLLEEPPPPPDRGHTIAGGVSDNSDNNSDDSRACKKQSFPDTSSMTTDEILEIIQSPILAEHTLDIDSLNRFLEPYEVGHMNHLIKIYTDSVMTIRIPDNKFECRSLTPVDYMDIHVCGVMQIYYILFKSEDFFTLSIDDQSSLLEGGILPALLSLSLPLFQSETKGWKIPLLSSDKSSLFLSSLDFLDILPKFIVNRTVNIFETSVQLGVDWTISMLFILIFIFTPIKKEISERDKINSIRNNYVKLLLRYLEWRHGPDNACLIFPELLKLMDALLRHSQEIENLHLWFKEEEIVSVCNNLKSLNLSSISDFNTEQNKTLETLLKEDFSLDYLSFFAVHSRLSSVMSRCFMNNSYNYKDIRHSSCLNIPSSSNVPLNLSPNAHEQTEFLIHNNIRNVQSVFACGERGS